jgi:hypothetical protein
VRGLALIDCAAASAAAVASAESVASAAAQAASAPLYAAEAHQKLPRGFAQAALQAWFPELDVNRGGFVSAKDLSFWCTAAGCQGQVSTENLESLFQPSLPSFAGPVAASAAFWCRAPRVASSPLQWRCSCLKTVLSSPDARQLPPH